MKTNDTKKISWATCIDCKGLGRILRAPSRKRKRLYQAELHKFEKNNRSGIIPKTPNSNMDICLDCSGSGLMTSTDSVKIDSENYPSIAIIGGGMGGISLAIACLHRGIPFTLYERDDSFDVRSQGYGLTLQQASKAIHGLGIFSLNEGIVSTKHIVHNQNGKIIGEWGLRKWIKKPVEKNNKRKNIHIARQSLRLELLKQLNESDSIRWGHKFVNFSRNDDKAFNLKFETDEKIIFEKADLIVAADGIYSSVRKLIIGENTSPLNYLGCIVILGICPLKSLDHIESPLFDSETVFQTVNGTERIYVMPYDKDTIMWQLSFPISESNAKKLSKSGAKAMKDEALKRLTWHDPIPQILQATSESKITGYPVYDREILDAELLQAKGNVTLIGDAAHPMSPFKGQGANQAIIDALNLARSISIKCKNNLRWRKTGLREIVLNDFELEMIQRTTPKVKGSSLAAKLLHSDAVLHSGDNPRGRGLNSE